jgi:hypothetical protein
LWYVSLAVFVYCALRWAREAFRLARLSPTLDSGSTSSKKSSHLNFYVPVMLVFTHIFAMAVVLAAVVPFTLTNQSASLQVNLEQLQSYFIGMSIVTVLVVVLELRLKTFEINEGLVRTCARIHS